MAKEIGYPFVKLQHHIESLEDEWIINVKDLEILVTDERVWKKITTSWPRALCNRIEAKLVEIKAACNVKSSTGL